MKTLEGNSLSHDNDVSTSIAQSLLSGKGSGTLGKPTKHVR